jgi:hypothetical protein
MRFSIVKDFTNDQKFKELIAKVDLVRKLRDESYAEQVLQLSF